VSERTEYFQGCKVLTGCKDSGLVQDFAQTGTMPAGATASREFPWGTSVTTTGEALSVSCHSRQWTYQKSAQVGFNLSLTSADIQHEIATGHARVVGNAVVDGVQTVELAISGFDGPGSSGDIWVDASSHLPVRTVVSAPTGTVQDDYHFLPATPANLAKLHPVIPAGSRRIPRTTVPTRATGPERRTGDSLPTARRRRALVRRVRTAERHPAVMRGGAVAISESGDVARERTI
jgi:hypothetical protein